jgi:hypothetical protein
MQPMGWCSLESCLALFRAILAALAWTFSAVLRPGMANHPAVPFDLALCYAAGYTRKLHRQKIVQSGKGEL